MSDGIFTPYSTGNNDWNINITKDMRKNTPWRYFNQNNPELVSLFADFDAFPDKTISEKELAALELALFWIDDNNDAKTDANELARLRRNELHDYINNLEKPEYLAIKPYLEKREKLYEKLDKLAQEKNISIAAEKKAFDSKIKEVFEKPSPERTREDIKTLNALSAELTNTYNRLADKSFPQNVDPNTKIDAPFMQGTKKGSCWLQATICSLLKSPLGRKILDETVTEDYEGNIIVNLRGEGTKYRFTKEEIKNANDYSIGDLDVRAIEMAVDKSKKERLFSWLFNDTLDGGWSIEAIRMLVPNSVGTYREYRSVEANDKFYKEIAPKLNNPDCIACATFSLGKDKELQIDKSFDKAILVNAHEYAITKIDDDYIYLINPWNCQLEFPVPIETFRKYLDTLTLVEILPYK